MPGPVFRILIKQAGNISLAV